MVTGVGIGDALGNLFLLGVTAWALVTGVRLFYREDVAHGQRLLALRLVGTSLVVSVAVFYERALAVDPGTWPDLVLFLILLAGTAAILLDIAFMLSHPRPFGFVRRRGWVRWVPMALPAILLVFLLVGWPGQPPVQPTEIAPGDANAWATWRFWFQQYDAVEDTVASAFFGAALLGVLALLAFQGYRALFNDTGPVRRRARRMLEQATWPPVAWVLSFAVVVLFMTVMPPGGNPVLEGLQAFLLGGPVGFSLLLLVPTLWGRDLLRDGGGPGADPAGAPGSGGSPGPAGQGATSEPDPDAPVVAGG